MSLRLPFVVAALALGLVAARAQTFTVVKAGSAIDGPNFIEPPVAGGDGKLYGVTTAGGANGYGVLYRTNADGSGYLSLFDFALATGAYPGGPPTAGSDGRLYLPCLGGGANGFGAIARVDRNGENFEVLQDLAKNTQGVSATGAILEASDGKLYGACHSGGSDGSGTLWRMNKSGNGFVVLHHFVSASDGANPRGFLLERSDSLLYGVTGLGGANGYGTLFRIARDGTGFTVLKNFAIGDGVYPFGGLVEVDGFLYGTTSSGGNNDQGTLYRISPAGIGFTVLKNFDLAPEARSPKAGLTFFDGFLYGTSGLGGANNAGAIFRIRPDGSGYEILQNFVAATDGSTVGGLSLVAPGVFLGGAYDGGPTSAGTLFRLSLPALPVAPPAPTLTLAGKAKVTTRATVYLLAGTAANATSVQVKSGAAAFRPARLAGAKWTFRLRLAPGKNPVQIRATGLGGASPTLKAAITRVR